ncbi:uncharacterized protein LOC124139620 [Haliotis rufescens]|uniref:uncharacterized protein LOC124139620 n=1 Tax=Haliotis rufescens TaxID=6454 RepID=UPI00201EA231|nr:uncharacterized protein LOC124139620 [Haliotis rufescens]
MDSKRNTGGNCFLYPEAAWPRVYNMAGTDMLLFAGRMAFRSDLQLASIHSDISVPETCASPVDAAIIWTERQLYYVRNDLKTIKKTSMRLSTRQVPPTLPTRMRGRVGVIEYELQEAERLRQIRERKQRREREALTQERVVMEEERDMRNTMSAVGCRKRKLEEVTSSNNMAETRSKRSRKPNSKYDSGTFLVHNGSGDSRASSNIVNRLRRRTLKRGH